MALSHPAVSDSIRLVERALAEIRKGRIVILTDDETREKIGTALSDLGTRISDLSDQVSTRVRSAVDAGKRAVAEKGGVGAEEGGDRTS